jgi:predicted small lipoprotein YifL
MLWFRFNNMKKNTILAAAARPLLILTLAACAFALTGCGKKEVIEEPGATPAAAIEQPALAKVHYWKTIAPFVAGAYAAQCLPASPPKLYADTLTINADGRVTAAGVNEDLAQATSIVLGRSMDKGLMQNAMAAEVGAFHLNMMVSGDGAKAVWSALKKINQPSANNLPRWQA